MVQKHYCNNKTVAAIGFFLASGLGFSQPSVEYASPMGEERWQMSGNPLRCGLALAIPNYGIGYFEQYATKPPHFILRKWDEVGRKVPAKVFANAPVWKPAGLSFLVSRTFIKPGAYGIFLSREPALKLLTYLAQGYRADFYYVSDQGFPVTVALSPVHFQKVYARYQRCLGGLFSFNFDDVRQSVFYYGVDSRELSDKDKNQLRRIAQYVAVDGQIEFIRVEGFADESGRRGYNNAISEYRAEEIKQYLLKLGVPSRKLSVTWYGASKPVARNDTDEGRALNRRALITLIKK